MGGTIGNKNTLSVNVGCSSSLKYNFHKVFIVVFQELQALRVTNQSLEKKTKFYEEQINYYNQYIQKCLENLHAGKR